MPGAPHIVNERMRAVVQTGYGAPDEVLQLLEVDPPAPADDEVLVRVHAASVHPDVWHVVRGLPYILRLMGSGLRAPKHRIPGTDMAGRVAAVGANVERFQIGDEVFGETVRGHQWKNGGAFAEYVAAPAAALAPKPAGVTFEQAAAVPTSGLIALRSVRGEGRVRPGQRVLVNGAGGGVGMLVVQIANASGATVTGVDTGAKAAMLRSIGADRTIDYSREDFTREGERYDLIVDIPGNRSLRDYRRALTPSGTYVLIGHDAFGSKGRRWIGSIGRFLRLAVASPFVSQRILPRDSRETTDPIGTLRELLDAGAIAPVVDRTFPLGEAADALVYLQGGHALGKVVITL
jgi:NADPH:quinone reductase-like Zn-dependent oxidoreductase